MSSAGISGNCWRKYPQVYLWEIFWEGEFFTEEMSKGIFRGGKSRLKCPGFVWGKFSRRLQTEMSRWIFWMGMSGVWWKFGKFSGVGGLYGGNVIRATELTHIHSLTDGDRDNFWTVSDARLQASVQDKSSSQEIWCIPVVRGLQAWS